VVAQLQYEPYFSTSPSPVRNRIFDTSSVPALWGLDKYLLPFIPGTRHSAPNSLVFAIQIRNTRCPNSGKRTIKSLLYQDLAP